MQLGNGPQGLVIREEELEVIEYFEAPTPFGVVRVDGHPHEYIPQAATAVVAILLIYAGIKSINKFFR